MLSLSFSFFYTHAHTHSDDLSLISLMPALSLISGSSFVCSPKRKSSCEALIARHVTLPVSLSSEPEGVTQGLAHTKPLFHELVSPVKANVYNPWSAGTSDTDRMIECPSLSIEKTPAVPTTCRTKATLLFFI